MFWLQTPRKRHLEIRGRIIFHFRTASNVIESSVEALGDHLLDCGTLDHTLSLTVNPNISVP